MPDETLRYYDEHVQTYEANTLHVDMTALYEPFLRQLPQGGSILDLGCGPGRDVAAFQERGFEVVGVDGSANMVAAARSRVSSPIVHATFDAIDWRDAFDGVWACASLLHVPRDALPDVLDRVVRAIKPRGVAFLSFKYGDAERTSRGRTFTDLTERGLHDALDGIEAIDGVETWTTFDVRADRSDERWLNALLRKRATRTTATP